MRWCREWQPRVLPVPSTHTAFLLAKQPHLYNHDTHSHRVIVSHAWCVVSDLVEMLPVRGLVQRWPSSCRKVTEMLLTVVLLTVVLLTVVLLVMLLLACRHCWSSRISTLFLQAA